MPNFQSPIIHSTFRSIIIFSFTSINNNVIPRSVPVLQTVPVLLSQQVTIALIPGNIRRTSKRLKENPSKKPSQLLMPSDDEGKEQTTCRKKEGVWMYSCCDRKYFLFLRNIKTFTVILLFI